MGAPGLDFQTWESNEPKPTLLILGEVEGPAVGILDLG
jgi:hypothetical protein